MRYSKVIAVIAALRNIKRIAIRRRARLDRAGRRDGRRRSRGNWCHRRAPRAGVRGAHAVGVVGPEARGAVRGHGGVPGEELRGGDEIGVFDGGA